MPTNKPKDWEDGSYKWVVDDKPVQDFLIPQKIPRTSLMGEALEPLFYGYREIDIKFKPQDPHQPPRLDEIPEITLVDTGKKIDPSHVRQTAQIDGKWYGVLEMKRDFPKMQLDPTPDRPQRNKS